MARPCKSTPDITPQIGEIVALGLIHALATEVAGITYKTFNKWLKKGENSIS